MSNMVNLCLKICKAVFTNQVQPMLACPPLVTQFGLGCILLLCADIDYTFLDLSWKTYSH
jgi:hypothetical protein